MSEHRITVAGGTSVRLPTGGKYCDRDIIVTAEGGGTELPTLNNPAAETDVVKGKEYIDSAGVKKTGMVEEVSGEFVVEDCVDFALDGASMVAVAMTPTGNGNLVRGETAVIVPFPADWTGSAAPEDVAAGKTFTSVYGVCVTGTAQMGGGGGLETVEIAMCDYMDRGLYVYYTDGNGQIQQTYLPSYDITIEVAKHTIVCIESYSDDLYPVDTGGEYSPVGNTWNVRKLTFTFGTNGYIRIATA